MVIKDNENFNNKVSKNSVFIERLREKLSKFLK